MAEVIMDNLIRNYSEVLTPEKCQHFIDKFEAHPEMQEGQNNSKGKTLTMMNLMNSADTPFREDLDFLGEIFMDYVEKYKDDCDIKSFQFPEKFGVEAFKIKRYLPDTTDEFPGTADDATVFFFLLGLDFKCSFLSCGKGGSFSYV